MKQKAINQAVKRLILNLGSNPSAAKINVALKIFHKEIVYLTTKERMRLMQQAIKTMRGQGLGPRKAADIASIWAISTARYNAEGRLVSAVYDIEEALNDIPLNMTKKARGIVLSWKDRVEDYTLMSEFKRAKTVKQAYKNIKFLGKTYIQQTKKNLDFYLLPDDEQLIYISQEDDRRDDVCGMLHGTTWDSKSDVPYIAQPLIHPNCRCRILRIDNTRSVKRRIKCDDAPKWALDMSSKNDGSNRLYGQGYSNFKKIKMDGECYIEYVTVTSDKVLPEPTEPMRVWELVESTDELEGTRIKTTEKWELVIYE